MSLGVLTRSKLTVDRVRRAAHTCTTGKPAMADGEMEWKLWAESCPHVGVQAFLSCKDVFSSRHAVARYRKNASNAFHKVHYGISGRRYHPRLQDAVLGRRPQGTVRIIVATLLDQLFVAFEILTASFVVDCQCLR
jgi:hypothetical protein